MIETKQLTKRYGKTIAVDEVSFTVKPGQVTGFLGPNGAGKSTTMRMILGLDTPSCGEVLVDGKPYHQLTDPLRSVGALLDAAAIVGARTAANHLTWLADSNGIARHRVTEVLDVVGLSQVAGKRVHVIGDTIVDSHTYSTMIGGQTKTPAISVLFEKKVDFVGGAAAVVSHMTAAGADATLSASDRSGALLPSREGQQRRI